MEFSLISTVPPGLPPSVQGYFQFMVQDLSVPHQITLPNAVTATAS